MPDLLQLDTCLACGGDDLRKFVDFGDTPLANAYRDDPSIAPKRYPLAARYCADCTHAQLWLRVDPDLMFRDYLYVTGTSQTLTDHFREMAAEVHVNAPPGPMLDLAANDGTVMRLFRELGRPAMGVDPARNLSAEGMVCGYWGEDLAEVMVSEHGQFPLVTAMNVLPHLPDPLGFLKGCKRALSPDGKLVIQFYYGLRVFERLYLDQFYHEHVSYWTVRSFEALAQRAGLAILDAQEFSIHGGSIRVTLAHEGEPSARFLALWATEARDEPAQVTFARALPSMRERFLELWYAENAPIVAYGAAAKANTSLEYFGVEPDWFVDDNPAKQGKFMPRGKAHILPVSSLESAAHWPVRPTILLTAWNFADEIQQRVREVVGGPSRYLRYVPEMGVTVA